MQPNGNGTSGNYEITYEKNITIVKLIGFIDTNMTRTLKHSIENLIETEDEGYILFVFENVKNISTFVLSLLMQWKVNDNILFYLSDEVKNNLSAYKESIKELEEKDCSKKGMDLDSVIEYLIKKQKETNSDE